MRTADFTRSFPASTVLVWLVQWTYSAAAIAAIALFGGGTVLAGFQVLYRDRIFPGVKVGAADLSGMTQAEAAGALSRALTYAQTGQIILRDGERTWRVTPQELGVALDIDATVAAAYTAGRSRDLFADLAEQFELWHRGRAISPVILYDYARAEEYLRGIAGQVDVPAREARIEIREGQVTVIPASFGNYLDIPQTIRNLQLPISNFADAVVPLANIEETPAVLDAAAQAEVAATILSAPLRLILPEARADDPSGFTLDVPALQAMLVVQRVSDGPNAAHYEVGLSPERLRAFLESLAPALARKPVNARFVFNDETKRLDLYKAAAPGRVLDIEGSLRAINARLVGGEHTVPLVFAAVPPVVGDDATAEQLGVTELLVSQSTFFAGSSPERINNITLGAGQFLGILIAPGETFSFNQYLGDVSLDTGYAEALIIYAGQTIQGVGGGICQVSTTAFRAAFFGGFPIVDRSPHAYRVQWYESTFGPGLDATVFAPQVDFKFRNDMNTWVLMEAWVYPHGELQFKLYGTPDGRVVEVNSPEITNVIQPEPDLYEEDASIPPGEVKQVEWTAAGGDVSVTRTVTSGSGSVLYQDNIRTRYQPWRAVYKVAPGELPPPVLEP